MAGARAGIRVIDFGQYVAGPLAAVMLADQGADVIHVDPRGGPRGENPVDPFFNRGTRRIPLDLKAPGGLATAQRLVNSADVVIENFRPGVMERLELGAESMTARNPQLVYGSIPGFAADDPRAGMRAWEGVIDAATHNCRPRAGEEPAGWDWSRPTYSALPLASNLGGFLAATGVVMALIARQRTGRAPRVEPPLSDARSARPGPTPAWVNAPGRPSPPAVYVRRAGCYRCADGR